MVERGWKWQTSLPVHLARYFPLCKSVAPIPGTGTGYVTPQPHAARQQWGLLLRPPWTPTTGSSVFAWHTITSSTDQQQFITKPFCPFFQGRCINFTRVKEESAAANAQTRRPIHSPSPPPPDYGPPTSSRSSSPTQISPPARSPPSSQLPPGPPPARTPPGLPCPPPSRPPPSLCL